MSGIVTTPALVRVLRRAIRRGSRAAMSAGLLLTAVASMPLVAQPGPADESVIALQGYSVVSYFDPGRAELGSPEYSVRHDGRVYLFTSEVQQRAFLAEPEAYLPKFGASCPYSLILGRAVAIDPTRFKVVGGQLLLFHNSQELDALRAWENDGRSDEELLEMANRRYELLRF